MPVMLFLLLLMPAVLAQPAAGAPQPGAAEPGYTAAQVPIEEAIRLEVSITGIEGELLNTVPDVDAPGAKPGSVLRPRIETLSTAKLPGPVKN